jgi:hypothetical protein
MCRTDIKPQAVGALAALLKDMAAALAAETGVDLSLVRVGPVDFGADPDEPVARRQAE